MRNRAECFFHRIPVIRAVFFRQISFDGFLMFDEFLINKRCGGRRLVDKGNGFGQILLDLRILRLDVGAHLSVDRQIFTLPLQRFLFVHKLPEAFTGFCDVSLRLCNLTQQLLRLFHRGVKLGLIGEQTAQIPGIFNSNFFSFHR